MRTKLNTLSRKFESMFLIRPACFFGILWTSLIIAYLLGSFFMLKLPYIIILIIIVLCFIPYSIVAYCRNHYTLQKFNQLRLYLQYGYLYFGMTQSIPNTLKEIEVIMDENIKNCIKETKSRLVTYEGLDYYEFAFKPIENLFLNSKVKTFHQFMKDVELKSSIHFQKTLDNLRFDYNAFVERTSRYLLELKIIKRNFKIAVIICLLISGVLCGFYRNHSMISSFSSHVIYQIVTTFYLASLFLIFIMSEIKLHGRWLYEDLDSKEEKKYVQYVESIRSYSPNKDRYRIKIFVLWSIFCLLGYVLYSTIYLWILLWISGSLALLSKILSHRKRKRVIARMVKKEFPSWLNTIALLLNDRLVPLAIKETQNSSFVFTPYIQEFVKEVEEDPKSVAPYCRFLSDYSNEDIANSMKTLYSIQNQTTNPSKAIHELVKQSQNILAESEKLRNKDRLAAIGFSIHTTTSLFMIKTICDLFLLIINAIQIMKGLI